MNRRSITLFALAAAVALTQAATTWATAFRNPPSGAKALAIDGGKTAYINDASAIEHNPANLADLERGQAQVSVLLVDSETEFSSPLAPSATTENNLIAIPSIFAVLPVGEEGGVVAGLGVYSPFGQSVEWDKASPFTGLAPYFAELVTIDVQPTIAARINETFSVGAGVNIVYSELDLQQVIPWSAVLGGMVPPGRLQLEGDGVGVGGNFGATANVADNQRVAVRYRLPFNVDYEGDTSVGAIPPPAAGLVAPRSDFDSEFKFPGILSLGYGIQVNDRLQVGADVEWVEFSRFETLPLDIGRNNPTGLVPPEVPQEWDDTWNAGVAASYACDSGWTARAGYKYLESPIPDETHAPTLPDADRHVVSVGMGYASGDHQVDVTYSYTFFEDREVSNNINPAFNGDYDLDSQLLALAYGLAF